MLSSFDGFKLRPVEYTQKKQTFTQNNTQEALLYFCHFLWKQSNLGNMQQTQARPQSRTGNALTFWRQ